MAEENDFTADFSKAFYYRWYYPLIVFGIFCIIFSAVFSLYQEKGRNDYYNSIELSPIKEYISQETSTDSWDNVKNFGILGAIICGVILTIMIYIIAGLLAITPFRRFTVTLPLIVLVFYAILVFMGMHFAYVEPHNFAIGNAIIFGFGIPLYITSFIMIFFNIAILILSIAQIVFGE